RRAGRLARQSTACKTWISPVGTGRGSVRCAIGMRRPMQKRSSRRAACIVGQSALAGRPIRPLPDILPSRCLPEPSDFLPVDRPMSRLLPPLAVAPFIALATVFAPAALFARPATAAPPVSAGCGGATTPIAELRGDGGPSPLAGQTTSIEAVVTA